MARGHLSPRWPAAAGWTLFGQRQLARVRAAAGEDGGAAAGAELDRLLRRAALGEREGQPGGEAVAAAVRVLHWARQRRGEIGAARIHPAAERAGGRDDELRPRLELARPVALAGVLPAPDECVELDVRVAQRLELARGRDEDRCPPGRLQRGLVAADEVDGVGLGELLPG